MNIVYCIHGLSNSGGMERVITTKANYLADVLNYDVAIITLNNDSFSFFAVSKKVKIIPVVLENLHYVLDCTIDFGADFFVSTGGKEISLLGSFPGSIKTIVELHFAFKYPLLREVSKKRNVFFQVLGVLKIVRQLYYYRKCDFVVSLTERDSTLWSKFLGKSRCLTIPNFIEKKSDINFSRNTKRLIAVGRLDEQKDFLSLIDAMSLVKANDWQLDIYGGGVLKEEIQNKINSCGLENKIFINEPTNNIDLVYRSSSVLLMTSYYEGMPMVLLEALSYGLPCVSFDCDSGPSDLIFDDKNGYLIKNRNLNDFALAVTKLLCLSDFEYKKLSSKSLESIKNHDIDSIMNKWRSLFEALT